MFCIVFLEENNFTTKGAPPTHSSYTRNHHNSKGGDESFDIFYQTETFGTIKYVLFASTDPKHQDKVKRLLEDGTDQDFYIHEEDLFKYYKYATKSLKAMVSNPDIPLKEKTEKIYEVSKGVMKELF